MFSRLLQKYVDAYHSETGKTDADIDKEMANLRNYEELQNAIVKSIANAEQAYSDAKAARAEVQQGNAGLDAAGTPRKSVEVANIGTDSTGKELTREQQDWAADSVIRDSKGRLKVMYHGTQNAGFTVFDVGKSKGSNLYGRGIYFSDSHSMAGDYGDTYEVYLNVTNPIQAGNKTITKGQLRKLVNEIAENEDYGIENYGYGTTVDGVVNSVWGKDDFQMLQDLNATCVGDFVETVKMFNELNGTDYDGIVDDTQTVVWHPYQIKATTNQAPTSSDDIRKSINIAKDTDKLTGNGESEKTKDLVAIHNLTMEQLAADIALGGFPSPSIAIVKSSMDHYRYGDVSVVFNRETIDPEFMKKNKVYGGDAWTPTFPGIEYDVDTDKFYSAADQLKKVMDGKSPDYLIERMERFNHVEAGGDHVTRDGISALVEAAKNDYGMKAAYLNTRGITVKDNTEAVQVGQFDESKTKKWDAMKPALTDIAEGFKEDYSKISSEELIDKYAGPLQAAYNDYAKTLPEESRKKYNNMISHAKKFPKYGRFIANDIYQALTYYKEGNPTHEEIKRDESAINSGIDKQINEEKFKKWIEKTYDGLITGRGIRNNKDMFTASGNRRSFRQLHYDVTLENLVKAMNEQDAKGADGFFAQSAIQAVATKDFRSIDEIHRHEGMLRTMTDEEYSALKEEHGDRFMEITGRLAREDGNSFIAREDAANAILDAVKSRKTAAGIESVLRKYSGMHVYEGIGQDILDLMNDIGTMPTQYFEAKPQRAVYLDEIAMVVAPDSISDFEKETLQGAGIPFTMYEAGNEDARHEAIEALEGVRFSKQISEDDKAIKDIELSADDMNKNAHTVHAMKPIGTFKFNNSEIRKGLHKNAEDLMKMFMDGRDSNVIQSKATGSFKVSIGGIKETLSHSNWEARQKFFPAIIATIENGEIVAADQNHKSKGYNTVVLAAQVTMVGDSGIDRVPAGDYYLAVSLKRKVVDGRMTQGLHVDDFLAINKNEGSYAVLGNLADINKGFPSSYASLDLHGILENIRNDVNIYENDSEKYHFSRNIDPEDRELTSGQQKYSASSELRDADGKQTISDLRRAIGIDDTWTNDYDRTDEELKAQKSLMDVLRSGNEILKGTGNELGAKKNNGRCRKVTDFSETDIMVRCSCSTAVA